MSTEVPQEDQPVVVRDHLLSNKTYDILKYIAVIVLPAVGTLYFAIAQFWHLGNATEVVGTIMAVDAFLGALLQISSKSYSKSESKYDGSIDVEENEEAKRFSLNLNSDPTTLDSQKQVLFKVNKPS